MSWYQIESEPWVLTEVLKEMQVKGLRVEELYSLDLECLNDLRPIYGLIFLCQWRLPQTDNRPVLHPQNCNPDLYFAKQVLNKACATQAILSILLNCSNIDIGQHLSDLKQLTKDYPPELKAILISDNKVIRNAHNSFAKPDSSVSDDDESKEKSYWTFVNYVPLDNVVYELDGLKNGPVSIGHFHGSPNGLEWLKVVRPILQYRVEKYMQSDINFSVLAIVEDMRGVYAADLKQLHNRKEQFLQQLKDKMDIDSTHGFDESVVGKTLRETEIEIECVKEKISEEDEKINKWKIENVRRKHDYRPFLFQYLKILAEKNKLETLIQKAKTMQKK